MNRVSVQYWEDCTSTVPGPAETQRDNAFLIVSITICFVYVLCSSVQVACEKLVKYQELLIPWCVKVCDPDWLHHWPCLWDWQKCSKVTCAWSGLYFVSFSSLKPLKIYKYGGTIFCSPKQYLCHLRLLAANYPGRCIFTDILQFVRDASVPRTDMCLEAWFCSKCFVKDSWIIFWILNIIIGIPI